MFTLRNTITTIKKALLGRLILEKVIKYQTILRNMYDIHD